MADFLYGLVVTIGYGILIKEVEIIEGDLVRAGLTLVVSFAHYLFTLAIIDIIKIVINKDKK